jgi:hypothetical protein
MDCEGWAMRLAVIIRQYCRHEIAAQVFGNERWVQRVCVAGVELPSASKLGWPGSH